MLNSVLLIYVGYVNAFTLILFFLYNKLKNNIIIDLVSRYAT